MEDGTKAKLTIGFLAFFASMWMTFLIYENPLITAGMIIVLLAVMLVLSYVIITILEWISIFDLKTNAILTLVVLTTFMITLTVYLLQNNTT